METQREDAAVVTSNGSTYTIGWREAFFHHHGYGPDSTQDRAAFVEPTKQQFTFDAFPGAPGVPEKQRRYVESLPPMWLVRFRGWLTWIDVQVTKLTRFRCLDHPETPALPPGISFHVKVNGTFTPAEDRPGDEVEFMRGL